MTAQNNHLRLQKLMRKTTSPKWRNRFALAMVGLLLTGCSRDRVAMPEKWDQAQIRYGSHADKGVPIKVQGDVLPSGIYWLPQDSTLADLKRIIQAEISIPIPFTLELRTNVTYSPRMEGEVVRETYKDQYEVKRSDRTPLRKYDILMLNYGGSKLSSRMHGLDVVFGIPSRSNIPIRVNGCTLAPSGIYWMTRGRYYS